MADVQLDILVEVKQALDNLQNFQQKAADSTSKIQGAFDGLKAVAAGAVAALAAGKVKDILDEGTKAAEAQQDSMTRLADAMVATGEFSLGALEDFGKFADEMERSTGIADDVVLKQAGVAKSFGLTNEQAQKVVAAAADLSTRFGTDLAGNVNALGKTFSGVLGKLDEQVVGLKSLTKEELAAGAAVDIITDAVGGAATRAMDTYSGATKSLGNAFGNLAEAVATPGVESKATIAAMQALAKVFNFLEDSVKSNQDAMVESREQTIHALARAVPTAVDALKTFVVAVETTAQIVTLAFSGLVTVIQVQYEAFDYTLGNMTDLFLKFASSLVETVDNIPGLGDGLAAIGVDFKGAKEALDDTRDGFNELRKDGRDALDAIQTKTAGFYEGLTESADSFNGLVDSVGAFAVEVAGDVENATGRLVAGADRAGEAQGNLRAGFVKSSDELGKLREKAEAFLKAAVTDALPELDKLQQKRDDALAQLDVYAEKFKNEPELLAQIADAEIAIRQGTSDKIAKILEEDDKKYEEELAKRKAALIKAGEEASQSPVKFLIGKIEISKEAQGEFQEQVDTTVGLLGKVLEGAGGAKSLIAEGAGAFADAFYPGIGSAVSGIVGKLAEGPDATKKFIKDFIDSAPLFVEKIAESIPIVVEVFVDQMVNHGGARRMGEATVRAMSGEATLKELGKQIGLSFGDSFNAEVLGKKLASGLATAGEAFVDGISRFPAAIEGAFGKPLTQLGTTIGDAGTKLVSGIGLAFERGGAAVGLALEHAVEQLGTAIVQGVTSIGAAAGQFFSDFGGQLAADFKDGAAQITSAIPQGLQDATTSLATTFSGWGAAVWTGLTDAATTGAATIGNWGASIWHGFTDALTAGAAAIVGIGTQIWQAYVDGFTKGAAIVKGIGTKIWDGLAEAGGKAATALEGFGAKVWKGLANAGGLAADKLGTFGAGVWKGFADAADSGAQKMTALGSDIWFGFIDAVNSGIEAVKKVGGKMWEGFVENVPGAQGAGGSSAGGTAAKIIEAISTGGASLAFGHHAKGGKIPQGYPGDSYLGALTTDERVLTPTQDEGLMTILEQLAAGGGVPGPSSGASNADVVAALAEIRNLLEQPMQVSTTAEVEGQALARIMLNLTRQNKRTA